MKEDLKKEIEHFIDQRMAPYKTIHMGYPIEVSANQFFYKDDKFRISESIAKWHMQKQIDLLEEIVNDETDIDTIDLVWEKLNELRG